MLSERKLEAYVCKHPSEVLPGLSIVKRQASVPHGVIDIIGWQDYELDGLHILQPAIIELKAIVALPKDVVQLLRYCFDVEALLCQSELVGFARSSEWKLNPVLICPAWTQNAMAACAYSEITVVRWQQNTQDQLAFTPIHPWRHCLAPYWRRPPAWFGRLIKHIREGQS